MFMHPKIDVRDTAKYRPYMKRRGTSSVMDNNDVRLSFGI